MPPPSTVVLDRQRRERIDDAEESSIGSSNARAQSWRLNARYSASSPMLRCPAPPTWRSSCSASLAPR